VLCNDGIFGGNGCKNAQYDLFHESPQAQVTSFPTGVHTRHAHSKIKTLNDQGAEVVRLWERFIRPLQICFDGLFTGLLTVVNGYVQRRIRRGREDESRAQILMRASQPVPDKVQAGLIHTTFGPV
jgi:hypothetical protein